MSKKRAPFTSHSKKISAFEYFSVCGSRYYLFPYYTQDSNKIKCVKLHEVYGFIHHLGRK